MFPIPATLDFQTVLLGLSNHTWAGNIGVWGTKASTSGFKFDTDKSLWRYSDGSFTTEVSNEWLSSDGKASSGILASDYECGYFNVTGDLSFLTGPARDTYHAITTAQWWYLYLYDSDSFGPFQSKSVTGEIRVREIAVPANEVTATMALSVSGEGIT